MARDGSDPPALVGVVSALLGSCAATVLDVDERDSVEDLHDLRVAIRRFRSDIRTFRPILDTAALQSLTRDLAEYARFVGAVRDRDVIAERLRERAAGLGPDADAALAVVDQLDAERADARAELSRYRASADHAFLRAEVERLRLGVPLLEDVPADPAKFVRRRLRKRIRSLGREWASFGGDPTDDQLHDFRKRAKGTRFAFEAGAPLLGDGVRKAAKQLKRLGVALGEFQDALVSEEWLRSRLGSCLAAHQAFAIGRLAEIERQAAAAARAAVPLEVEETVRQAAGAVEA